MPAEYNNKLYKRKMEVSPCNGHQTKGGKNDLIYSGGLNRFMAGQPRTYSQFLYNSSLAAHMFKTSTINIFHANITKQFNHSTKLQMASLV